MSVAGTLALMKMIEDGGELALKQLHFGEADGKLLLEELLKKENSYVHSLGLLGLKFDSVGPMWIGELLAQSSCLTRLLLHHLSEDLEPVKQIVGGITRSKSLTAVDLSFPLIKDESVVTLVCEMLRENNNLRELSFRCNSAIDAASVVLDEVFIHRRINKFRAQMLSEEHMRKVCYSLKNNNTCLHTIDLYLSKVSQEGKKVLADWLANDTVLEKLRLSSCSLGQEGGVLIAKALQHNTVLKKLDLTLNGIDAVGCRAVADMLRANSTLQELSMLVNIVGEEGVEALARALVGHRSLKKLRWPFPQSALAQCDALLWDGNGSLLGGDGHFKELYERNKANQDLVRQAVQTLRVLRWRDEEKDPNILHVMQKDIVRIIGRCLWATRTEVETWSPQKEKSTKRTKQN